MLNCIGSYAQASKRGDYLKCESIHNKLTVRCNKRPKPKGAYCSEHEDEPEPENETCADWPTITEIWRAQMDNSCPAGKTVSGESDGSKNLKDSARAYRGCRTYCGEFFVLG